MLPDWLRGPAIVIYAVYLVLLVSVYIDRRLQRIPAHRCSWCQKWIAGRFWYHLGAKVSHGMCTTCGARSTRDLH